MVDPDDEIEVRAIISFHGRDLYFIEDSTPLDQAFTEFKKLYNHMMIVITDPS